MTDTINKAHRSRRLRATPILRQMVRETTLTVDDLIYPLFVAPGEGVKREIGSMPGVYHFSVDTVVQEAEEVAGLGIPAILLFGLPETKDEQGSGAYDENGIVQRAVRAIKKKTPNLVVITDVCLCEYTSHGHCGLLNAELRAAAGTADFKLRGETVDNDTTLDLLARTAVSHAAVGADIVAPSDMMDFRVAAIRQALDNNGFSEIPILSYAAKYASAFYGPFREAADNTPSFGDRRSYQMDPANRREALKEVAQDIAEGADMVMVKPALAYLDIIREVRGITNLPLAAYNISGEYAMVKFAAKQGLLDERAAAMEVLTAIRRAGADLVITYHAKDAARWLRGA